jgi:hypothetical protein
MLGGVVFWACPNLTTLDDQAKTVSSCGAHDIVGLKADEEFGTGWLCRGESCQCNHLHVLCYWVFASGCTCLLGRTLCSIVRTCIRGAIVPSPIAPTISSVYPSSLRLNNMPQTNIRIASARAFKQKKKYSAKRRGRLIGESAKGVGVAGPCHSATSASSPHAPVNLQHASQVTARTSL